MNSRGWRCLPPVLQTKHNFYLRSDLWLLRAVRGGRDGGHGAGAEHRARPHGIEMQRRTPPFVRHHGGFTRNPSTQINYCYLYPLGPGPPACLSSAAAERTEILIPFLLFFSLSFLSLLFSFPIYFCFNLHIIISAKTSEITSDK